MYIAQPALSWHLKAKRNFHRIWIMEETAWESGTYGFGINGEPFDIRCRFLSVVSFLYFWGVARYITCYISRIYSTWCLHTCGVYCEISTSFNGYGKWLGKMNKKKHHWEINERNLIIHRHVYSRNINALNWSTSLMEAPCDLHLHLFS